MCTRGFWELYRLGWIERIPRIFGVQSAGSAAIYNAWRDRLDLPRPVAAATVADSIGVNAPRDAVKALRAVRESGGAFVLVQDEAILQGDPGPGKAGGRIWRTGRLRRAGGPIRSAPARDCEDDETVVAINTGSGLKDVLRRPEWRGSRSSSRRPWKQWLKR